MLLAHKENLRVARSQRGFTLIEVLVTFVVLAIGLLGIVSLQALSKTSQHQGIQRTRAVAIADGMLEKIRINPAGLATYAIGLNPLGDGTISSEPTPNCISAVCNTTQMAAHDLWQWEQALDGTTVTVGGVATAGLINPQACVIFTAATGKTNTGLLQVLVQWSDLRETIDAVQAGDVDVACGGAAAGGDRFRRKVTASTFVIDEDEL
ncbi:MAG: type IV pilus assembly protein PilV [Halioglobus sp.]|jgi:type IV pilus assembly protein PilV